MQAELRCCIAAKLKPWKALKRHHGWQLETNVDAPGNDKFPDHLEVISLAEKKGLRIQDANIPFGPLEANGWPILSINDRLEDDRHPLPLMAADAVVTNVVNSWNWRNTCTNGKKTWTQILLTPPAQLDTVSTKKKSQQPVLPPSPDASSPRLSSFTLLAI